MANDDAFTGMFAAESGVRVCISVFVCAKVSLFCPKMCDKWSVLFCRTEAPILDAAVSRGLMAVPPPQASSSARLEHSS